MYDAESEGGKFAWVKKKVWREGGNWVRCAVGRRPIRRLVGDPYAGRLRAGRARA